ncbi:hypothetical protein KIN20_008077 [Parelaphostrongylus tenuis]|uniref:Uncharacterized protein n=1 Tax=Parelaphostrongylus tenuis TaxID=148309 RepID=A0AAD5M915_PARTN|nr:hypothetical protein KIN20_008077 [Parelaphostrongylus tenuis]
MRHSASVAKLFPLPPHPSYESGRYSPDSGSKAKCCKRRGPESNSRKKLVVQTSLIGSPGGYRCILQSRHRAYRHSRNPRHD